VFRDCFHFALSALLLAVSLPLLAVSFLIAALSSVAVAILPGFLKRSTQDVTVPQKLRVVDQFNFAEAMNAYEELIGAHARRQG
jgi:hypothetical protein